jgi:hypothetical protein
MPKHHRRLTEAERDERRARDRERLEQACEQLLSSEGWQRWVRARARNGLARYSVSNLCLLDLGYCVRKGEHAIWIFAPMPTRRRDEEPTAETDEEQRRLLFRAVPVFDRCQVDALDGREPAPLEPPSQPVTGDSNAHLIEPAAAFARSCGYAVAFESTPAGTGGWCNRPSRRIVVDAAAPANAQLRIVIHETAHALGIDYQTYTRQKAKSSSTPSPTSSAPASGSRSTARASPTLPAGAKTAHWTPSATSPPRSTGSPARSRTPSAALRLPLRAEPRTRRVDERAQNPTNQATSAACKRKVGAKLPPAAGPSESACLTGHRLYVARRDGSVRLDVDRGAHGPPATSAAWRSRWMLSRLRRGGPLR